MSHLVTCPGCKSQMANEVRRCPQCSYKMRPGLGPGPMLLIGLAVAAAVAVAVVMLTR